MRTRIFSISRIEALRKFLYQLEKVKKVLKRFLKVELNSFHLYGKPTRDMTEIENAKIILVQQHIYNSVCIFSVLCYSPNPRQNNKKETKNLGNS